MLVGISVIAGFVALVVSMILRSQQRYTAETARQEQVRAERQRLEDCGRVVLECANHLGYLARQVITRDELEARIDQGCSADELVEEICSRMDAVDGMILGTHLLGESHIPVKLTLPYRERHVYIIGKSGSGKTNLLRTMILQDIGAGAGIGVLAPEQEMLTDELLPYIPDHRLDDVIYLNPADTDCPVTFNPLHLDEGEDIDLKVDEVVTIFQRVLGDTGPRMAEILRQALYLLIARPGSTLLDVERLLDRSDGSFRKEVIQSCREPEAAQWWQEVYPSFPKDAHLPITNRLGRFLHPRSIRRLLCTPGKSLDFGLAMDEGKIVLCNLSDGILGEQNSQILGQLIVSKFQLAVMGRARQPKGSRRPFYLYLDEFQTFTGAAGASYEKMLSRARKYKLGLILAHQQTGQISSSLLKEILGNVSTTICFLISREDALRFSKEFVTHASGELTTIPEEEFLRLRVGQAWCKMGEHAFRMRTHLAPQRLSRSHAERVIARSRQLYGTPVRMLGAAPEEERSAEERADQQPSPAPLPPTSAALPSDWDPAAPF